MSTSTHSRVRAAVLLSLSAVVMLVAQIIFVSQQFDAYVITKHAGVNGWWEVFAYFGQIPKLLAISIVAYLLVRQRQRVWKAHKFFDQIRVPRFVAYMSVQWLCYLIFLLLTQRIYSAPITKPPISGIAISESPASAIIYVAWIAVAALIIAFWLLALSSFKNIAEFVSQERWPILMGAGFGFLILGLSLESQTLWTSLSTVTLLVSRFLLSGYDTDLVTLDIHHQLLGLGDFVVEIAPVCSGYEGMGLITGLCALYLYIYRREFKFPNALLLLPMGAAIAWLLNCARIAVLIIIGYQWSPQVAVGGFHSNAGWIGFILTACLLLFVAGKFKWFAGDAITQHPAFSMTPAVALLIPFVVLMASVLISSALFSHFDFLYPARVVLVGSAIIWSWQYLDLSDFHFSAEPVLIGVAVALFWIAMSPLDRAANRDIHQALAALSVAMGSWWIIFRVLGSILIVPIVEEFVFRGYLLAKLSGSAAMTKGRIPIAPLAVVISAVSFGLLHASWLAGIVAGLAYVVVRLRTLHLGHAITAHATTNLIICVYALLSENWSAL